MEFALGAIAVCACGCIQRAVRDCNQNSRRLVCRENKRIIYQSVKLVLRRRCGAYEEHKETGQHC